MPNRVALNVSLTPALAAIINAEVQSGQYGSASEVVQGGLRLLVKSSAVVESVEHSSPMVTEL